MSEASGRGFGYWLNIFANLAAVAGIVFLGVQIRQNTAMTEAQMNQSRTDAAMVQQQGTYNSEFMPPIMVKLETEEELTHEEMRRFESHFRSFSRNMDNQLGQYSHGFLGENIPRSMRSAVRGVTAGNQPSLDLWDASKLAYTDEYVAFVEEAIADLRGGTP